MSRSRGVVITAIVFSVVVLVCLPANAAPIAGPFVQGQATATVGLVSPTTNPSAVYTTPGTATATNTDGSSTSTTTAVFTLTSGSFNFNQSVSDPDATSGSAYGDFIASVSFNFYTINDGGASCTSCTFDTVTADTTLTDLRTNQVLYDSMNGGSTSGSLIVGDEYQFSANASLVTTPDPLLTYGPSLNLSSSTSVPEDPAPLVPVILGAFVLLRRKLHFVIGPRNN